MRIPRAPASQDRAPLICEISYRDARVSPDFNCLCSS
jgi:hypothetical protein